MKAGIGIGVITNHNKFDLDEFKALRKKAKKSGVGLLPGVELSVNDGQSGVHTLVVFSDDWIYNKPGTNYIQRFLNLTFAGIDHYEHENARSTHDIVATVHALDTFHKDYFLVFAHVEALNGLWGGLAPGRIKTLFENETVRRRALAWQKVRTRDDRDKIQQALGHYYPAEVEGRDAKSLADMAADPKKVCYLKLGDWSFEAVKYALRDHTSRVRTALPAIRHSYIQSISIEGTGTLGGTNIHLTSGLNTLIGIRGSGKSSVLEAIRYALDLPFGKQASDVGYKKDLVEHVLRSGGKITLEALDRRGQAYQIRRILGERPDVYVNGQKQPGVSLQETVLHQPLYFGQKDLANTGAGFEQDLIEKLVGDTLFPIRQKITQAGERVIAVIAQIKRLQQASAEQAEWLQKKQDAAFQLQFYQQHDLETKLQKQLDFARDERKATQIIQGVQHYLAELNSFIALFEDDLHNWRRYQSTHNAAFFEGFFAIYQQLLQGFQHIQQAASAGQSLLEPLQQQLSVFTEQKSALKEEFAAIERKLSAELQQAGAQAVSPQAFKRLKQKLEQAEQMLAVLGQQAQRRTELDQALDYELDNLNAVWLEEYQAIEQILNKINQADSPLKIVPQFKADKAAMWEHMQDVWYGNIQGSAFTVIVKRYNDFGEMWREATALKWPSKGESHHPFLWDLEDNLAGSCIRFWQYFMDNLDALLTWQVPNLYTIEYHGKALAQHSLGQRASALMLFVLSQRDNDVVIIDQPEDDLDNQTLYADVISLLRALKPHTQFIFATHNPNIPVLGDAEQVITCRYVDDHIQITSGSIDCAESQQQIVNIMEGGAEAFEKRKQVYAAWKPRNS